MWDKKRIIHTQDYYRGRKNENSLLSELLRLLHMPADQRQALGQASRERVKERYAIETIVSKYLRLYAQLIKKKRECAD